MAAFPNHVSLLPLFGRFLLIPALTIFLASCAGMRESGRESERSDEDIPDVFIEFNPNVRVGEITWVNDRNDYVVVLMDRAVESFEPTFFLAMDPLGQEVSGYLLGGGIVEGRSFGARVLEGTVMSEGEVRIPGEQWTDYLFNRYRDSGILPNEL
jgi:hypothetical protein